MAGKTYRLRWGLYKSNLFKGFSQLQQTQEFVDVTIAAGGHLIGAHQNILALASPYFKKMLKSARCRHPVIFLAHINPTVLACILEYVYTGEVQVPSNEMRSFVEAAKMLYITGIKDIELPEEHRNFDPTIPTDSGTQHDYINRPVDIPELNLIDVNSLNKELAANSNIDTVPSESQTLHNSRSQNTVAHVAIGDVDQITVEPSAVEDMQLQYTAGDQNGRMSNDIKYEVLNVESNKYGSCDDDTGNDKEEYLLNDENLANHNEDCKMETDFENGSTVTSESHTESPETNQADKSPNTQDNTFTCDIATKSGIISLKQIPETKKDDQNNEDAILGNVSHNVLYAFSTRGSLMMLLNRYIYNMHFTSFKGRKRRWRCIEYRRCRCPAYVDTFDEGIKAGKNAHVHGFHDAKIIILGKSKQLYTSLSKAVLEPRLKINIYKKGNGSEERNFDEESE